MKRLLVGLLATFASLALVLPADASHGSGKHWPGSGDRNLRLVDSVGGRWDAALVAAADAWSASGVVDLIIEPGSTSRASRKKCKPKLGTIRVCNLNYGRTGWAGIATYWWTDGGHIVKAKAKLNSTYVKDEVGRQKVACHEIGHTLGLGHSDETSCLYFRLEQSVPMVPNAHDFEELGAAYTHSHQTAFAASEQVTVGKDGNYRTTTIKLLAHP